MNLLIVSATELEIEPFLKGNNKADVLITGVGIPNTVFHLTKKLMNINYDLVIQAGIAGAFGNGFNLEEVVQVGKDTFADLGIEENGKLHTLFEMGFMSKNEFPFIDGWLENGQYDFEKNNLPIAKGITANKIGDNKRLNQQMQEKFSAGIESMEGAAFHYVCLQQKINFLQLRAISNHVGERDKSKWEIKNAISNLNYELIKLIENF